MSTPEKVAAEVAAEAIVNQPSAYDGETRAMVLRAAIRANLSESYLDDLRAVL